jgi:hypothetical protein
LWIVIGLVSLVVLVLLILCIPVDLVFEFNTHTSPKSRKRLLWFFGLIRKDLGGGKIMSKKKGKGGEVKKRPGNGKRMMFIFRILQAEGLVKHFSMFIKEIISRLQIKNLRANITLGLENPADTGILFAWLFPAHYILQNVKWYEVNLQPSFEGDLVFEGFVYSYVRMCPIRFTTPLMKLLFSPTTLRVIKVFFKRKWKEK